MSLATLEADRVTSVANGNPESLIDGSLCRCRLEDDGCGVAAGAGAGTVADGYRAPHWRPCAVDAVAELHDGLSASRLNSGELAIARAGIGKTGDKPPALTVHGDCHAASLQSGVAHDELPKPAQSGQTRLRLKSR